MVIQKDNGTCCCIFPLKFGVGMISMYTFAVAVVYTLALLTGDVRFQSNGYNLNFYLVPSVMGALGLLFGFIGMLGTYDDNTRWLRIFNAYFQLKLIAIIVTMIADYYSLQDCESSLSKPEHVRLLNPQMDSLARQGICPSARSSYLVGCIVDLTVNMYWFYCCVCYQKLLQDNPQYAIFSGLQHPRGAEAWQFYGVKDPRADMTAIRNSSGAPVYGTTYDSAGSTVGNATHEQAHDDIEQPRVKSDESNVGKTAQRKRPQPKARAAPFAALLSSSGSSTVSSSTESSSSGSTSAANPLEQNRR